MAHEGVDRDATLRNASREQIERHRTYGDHTIGDVPAVDCCGRVRGFHLHLVLERVLVEVALHQNDLGDHR